MRIKLVSALFIAALMLTACGSSNPKKETDKGADKTEDVKKEDTPKVLTNVTVLIETTEGNIKVKLYDETPLHRDNFVKLVKSDFYNGTIFHRVIKGFMIQAGDPTSKNPVAGAQYGMGDPGYTIPAEINTKFIHKKGALSAARTNNPEKKSSGSQFYIVHGEKFDASKVNPSYIYSAEEVETYKTIGGAPHLDGDYTVFGETIEGLDVIDKIAATKTAPGDRPVKDILITKMTIVE